MGDEARRHLPVTPAVPVLQAGEAQATVGIRVLDPQCQAAATRNHRGQSLALVEGNHAGALCVRIAAQCTAQRSRAVDGDRGIGHEAGGAVADGEHAEVCRPHLQANAIVGIAAHAVRTWVQPMHADQAGPTIRLGQLGQALRAPGLLDLLERGIGRRIAGGLRRIGCGGFAMTGRCRTQARQHDHHPHQRPRRNHRSISARLKRVQVGRP